MTSPFHVHPLAMSRMIELVSWDCASFCSSLKGLRWHVSPVYEILQSGVLSPWIGLFLLLPYKTLKLLILIKKPCAYSPEYQDKDFP